MTAPITTADMREQCREDISYWQTEALRPHSKFSVDFCVLRIKRFEAILARLEQQEQATEILARIIYASDGCVGHRDCNHSIQPWKDARHLLGLEHS